MTQTRDPSVDETTLVAPGADQPATSRADASTSAIGQAAVVGGRYEILGLLGTGGMGSVYKVRDREIDEVVALKVLRREMVSRPGSLDRFRRELKLARKVTHTNVARSFDIGEHDGEKFLTMEFVDGESLAERLARSGTLPIADVVALAREICAGLVAAHAAGVIHRDLKPENILIARDGRVVITDFGIARAEQADAGAARQTMGVPVGTPLYMAPEQVEGAREIDSRADLYALGAMLFELLTGQPPFDGETTVAIMVARLTRPAPDVRTLRQDVPERLAELVRRCLARAPADRPASASDVASALAHPDVLSRPADAVSTAGAAQAPGSTGRASARPARAVDAMPATTTGALAKSVAVLPFRNAGTPEDDYVADGLTEDLIDTLSMTPGLRVRSRGAVMRFKGRDADPREIGREIDVDVVIEGSVRRARANVRVSARVISVHDGFQLWAQRFDRPEGDILVVSDEVAQEVARALLVQAAPPPRVAPANSTAIDLYLRGRNELRQYHPDSVAAAARLFDEALALAPDDASTLSAKASAYVRLWFLGHEAGRDGLVVARQAAEHAVRVAPHLGEPYVALATIALHSGDPYDAARQVRTALARSPMLPTAHGFADSLLIEAGRIEEGIRRCEVALSLDPFLFNAHLDLARASALLGNFDKCDELMDRLGAWAVPDTGPLLDRMRARFALWRGDVIRAGTLLRLSSVDVVREVLGGQPSGSTSPGMDPAAPRVDAHTIRDEVVRTTFGEVGQSQRRRALAAQIGAEVAAATRDRDATIAALRRCAVGAMIDVAWFDRCPLLDPFRGDPEFGELRDAVAERAQRVIDAWQEA